MEQWRLSDMRTTTNHEGTPPHIDGVLVRSVENTHWHQPLYLIFDSETMPEWFGMPNDNDLPSTFSIEINGRPWSKWLRN